MYEIKVIICSLLIWIGSGMCMYGYNSDITYAKMLGVLLGFIGMRTLINNKK